MTVKQKEGNKALRTQLAELNKDGKSYKIKKWKDSAAGQVNCFPCTDNYHGNTSQKSTNILTTNDLNIVCLFTNAQSIVKKLAELQANVYQHSPEIIGIAETWCTNEVGNAELHLQGYDLFRNDRVCGVGGGVMLYVRSDLSAIPCSTLNDVGFDNSTWRILPLSDNEKLLIGVVYRSPSSPLENNHKLLYPLLLTISTDFNLPSINWSEYTCISGESSLAHLFLDTIQDSFLTQHVSNCTRHRDGQQSSLLDLV